MKSFTVSFDPDPHITLFRDQVFLRFLPGNELAIRVNLVEVPFQHHFLVLGDEIRYGITKGLSRSFNI